MRDPDPFEIEAGAKALCQHEGVPEAFREHYWVSLPDSLRDIYRGQARDVLVAVAKFRAKEPVNDE